MLLSCLGRWCQTEERNRPAAAPSVPNSPFQLQSQLKERTKPRECSRWSNVSREQRTTRRITPWWGAWWRHWRALPMHTYSEEARPLCWHVALQWKIKITSAQHSTADRYSVTKNTSAHIEWYVCVLQDIEKKDFPNQGMLISNPALAINIHSQFRCGRAGCHSTWNHCQYFYYWCLSWEAFFSDSYK